MIDSIRGFACAFSPDSKMPPILINAYTQYFLLIKKWPTEQTSRPRKILSSIYTLMSNKYKIHIQFNSMAYESVSNFLRSGYFWTVWAAILFGAVHCLKTIFGGYSLASWVSDSLTTNVLFFNSLLLYNIVIKVVIKYTF